MHKASDMEQGLVPLASCILSLQGLGLKRGDGKRERESRIQQTRWRKRLGRVGNKQLTVPLTVAVSGRGSPPLSPLSPPCQTTSARKRSSGRRHCTRQPCPGRAALSEGLPGSSSPSPGEIRAGAHTHGCTAVTTHIGTPGVEAYETNPQPGVTFRGGPARPCPARVPPSRSSGARRCAGAGAPGPT